MPSPTVSRRKQLSLAAIATAATFVALVGSASATSSPIGAPVPTQRNAKNGALILRYRGHSYTCYRGDLCVWRGGRYEAYYKCRTVANATTSDGWAVNNQYGAGGTAAFYGRPGWVPVEYLRPGVSAIIHWRGVRAFRVCTS
jgi:hypothetical protein